jgi:hypothetical protein
MSDESSLVKPTWRSRAPQLSKAAWAWEYSRRNEDIRMVWRESQPAYQTIEIRGAVQIIGTHAPDRSTPWPWLYASSPDEDASTAMVLWWPELNPSVLRAFALADKSPPSAFRIDEFGLPVTILRTPDGLQHVVIRDNADSLQLMVRGADLNSPVSLLVDTCDENPAYPEAQIIALRRLRQLRATGRIQEHGTLSRLRNSHYNRFATALDGHQAGESQRTIAIRFFGAAAVQREWADPRGLMRDIVRYATVRGRALSDRGYLDLLI